MSEIAFGTRKEQDHTIELSIDGSFPELDEEVSAISFTPTTDLIEEVANIAGVDVADYGNQWFLRGKQRNRTLHRDDGILYTRRSRRGKQRLELTTIPF